MSEWKPIETAPKDEQDIVLACFDEKWNNGAAVMVGSWDGKCFAVVMGYQDENSTCVSMFTCDWTHWMPLPTPPEPKRAA